MKSGWEFWMEIDDNNSNNERIAGNYFESNFENIGSQCRIYSIKRINTNTIWISKYMTHSLSETGQKSFLSQGVMWRQQFVRRDSQNYEQNFCRHRHGATFLWNSKTGFNWIYKTSYRFIISLVLCNKLSRSHNTSTFRILLLGISHKHSFCSNGYIFLDL